MPIYEYKCMNCGRVTEVFFRSLQQDIEVRCSNCRSKNIKKIFSAPSSVSIAESSGKGVTCCGRSERCETPPCGEDKICRRDKA